MNGPAETVKKCLIAMNEHDVDLMSSLCRGMMWAMRAQARSKRRRITGYYDGAAVVSQTGLSRGE